MHGPSTLMRVINGLQEQSTERTAKLFLLIFIHGQSVSVVPINT